MADYPALKLWTDAYLSDTSARISVEEHGVYMLLMQLAWREGNDARLPPTDECVTWIKGVCKGMHGRTAGRLVGIVLQRFWRQDESGDWYQKRLEKEWKHVRKTSETRSKVSRKRWGESSENNKLSNAKGYARARVPPPPPLPLDSESVLLSESIQGVSESERNSGQLALTGEISPGGFERFWNCWTIPGTKRGKGTAKTKFAAVVRRGEISPDKLCQAVSAYMAWCLQSDLPPSKIKHPSTWLHAKCWDDDLVLDPPPRPKWNGDPRTRDTFEVLRDIDPDEDMDHGQGRDQALPCRVVDGDEPHTGAGREQGQAADPVLPKPEGWELDPSRRGQGFRQPFAGPGLLAVVGEGRGTAEYHSDSVGASSVAQTDRGPLVRTRRRLNGNGDWPDGSA